MERPYSAASSTTTHSTTGPIPKRSASTRNVTRPTSTVVSLFVTNLRLLDFDLLPDWPNISTSSFSNQDARIKTKCTEYALYQLFRIYDPATTADKLQPFFPPLEPLQSVNLRAALYRCLNELKRNGVLSRDTALRKSMLDECQGERFWEVCLSFSVVVLRKVTLEKRSRHGRPVAERLGTAQAVSRSQRESMLPLSIAHRAALAKVLDQKQRKKETYTRLYDLLAEKEAELLKRKMASQENAQKTQSKPGKLKTIEQVIQKGWVGSSELKDALVNGDTCAKGDGMLIRSFDDLWQTNGENIPPESGGAEVGLLQSVNDKAIEQNVRLRRWQSYHDQLLAAKPASTQTSRSPSAPQRSTIRFDKHRNLNVRDPPSDDEKLPQQQKRTRERHVSASRYDDILTTMREGLRKNSAHRNLPDLAQPPPIQSIRRAQTQPMPMRKPSLAVDASPGASNPHARSPSQTAVPVRPAVARRVPSKSRSYQQPKVAGQRELVPLKSELFSPLKDKRRNSISPTSASSMLPSPLKEADSPGALDGESVSEDSQRRSEASGTPDGGAGFGISDAVISNGTSPSPKKSPIAGAEKATEAPGQDAGFKKPDLPEKKAFAAVRPSLVERTRMSMAFNSSDDIHGILPEPSVADSPDKENHSEEDLDSPDILPSFDRRASLLERTRQSISMAPPPPTKTKKSSHTRSRTSIHPINQFDTPKKLARRSTIGVEEGDDRMRKVTPLEQLLSPDAEYDSVFKSRPKIALSPVLTPRRDGGSVSMDSLDGDVGRSSPLVGVGGRE